MAKKQITISVDEQWLDAIDRNANPGFCLTQTLESLTVDFVAKVLVPEPEYAAVSRAIADENQSRSASIIAANAAAEKPKFNIITVKEKGTSPSFMVWDEGLYPIIKKVRAYPGVKDHFAWTFCDMFPGKLIRQKNESFDMKIAEYLFHPELSDIACIYSVDLDNRKLGVLKKWITPRRNLRAFASWRFFNLDGVCSLLDCSEDEPLHGFPDTIWYYLDDSDLQLSISDTPDIYISGIRELAESDVRFEDEVDQDDNILQFYLGTYFDPDAVFGTYVCTEKNDNTVNAYAYFDLEKDDVVDELSVIVCPSSEFPDEVYKYRLTPEEKALIRRKMDAYLEEPDSQGHAITLAQLRAEYIHEKGKEKKQR